MPKALPIPQKSPVIHRDVPKQVQAFLCIGARNSNPNGDPDNQGAPRTDVDDHVFVTDKSIKHRVRNLISDEGTVSFLMEEWLKDNKAKSDEYEIYATPTLTAVELKALQEELKEEGFHKRFVDARLFGNTFLEGLRGYTRRGPIQMDQARSVNPAEVIKMTTTRKMPEEDKKKSMNNDAIKLVKFALLTTQITVSPEAARYTWLTPKDVDLFFRLLQHAYDTNSCASAGTYISFLVKIELNKGRRIHPDKLNQLLTPVLKPGLERPTNADDYIYPDPATVKKELESYGKVEFLVAPIH
jgi:CRISPR-associated protein Csd2